MQKPATQIKPKKDKKKNTETGLLMGQNTNIFSQLSANYLTTKANATEHQENFAKETQIIEYHDQNINRLISLLRKKAEVTKVKAILELKEEICLKMTPEELSDFMPTYSNLFQEIVLHEQSKQVYEEFVEITANIFENHKKLALKQIQTFYPSMLISMKLQRLLKLLFSGSQEQQQHKALALLLKKQPKKKFLIICKILLQQNEKQLHLLTQSNYQRNISSLCKVIKDTLSIYSQLNKEKKSQYEKDLIGLVMDIEELLSGKSVDQYFKIGGKGKATLIELFAFLVSIESLYSWNISWKRFAKVVCQHFLDKDPLVQQTLWKNCNKQMVISLRRLSLREKEQDPHPNSLFQQYLPKYEDKLLDCLHIGGMSMYRNLPSYLKEFPSTQFGSEESHTHKSLIQKLNFSRKLLQTILAQEDENETRVETYLQVSVYLIESLNYFEEHDLADLLEKEGQKIGSEGKKQKQIISLIQKLKRETIENLQKKFYSQPPQSKNSFSYYIPPIFCKLLNQYPNLKYTPTFKLELTFKLYKNLNKDSPILDEIYSRCEKDLSLQLMYLENWPQTQTPRQIKLDMSDNNDEYEKTARVYLISHQHEDKSSTTNEQQKLWFQPHWDLRKSSIIFDPRITSRDLEVDETHHQHDSESPNTVNLNFTPILKEIPSVYHSPQLNPLRFKFFLSLLTDQQFQISNIKFFLPYLKQYLLTEQNMSVLMKQYQEKYEQLQQSKWQVGQREVVFIRIICDVVVAFLLQNKYQKEEQEGIPKQYMVFFRSIGDFLRVLNAFKMTSEIEQILKSLNRLQIWAPYEMQLFECAKSTFTNVFKHSQKTITSTTTKQSTEDKLRKNRLKRTVDFIELIVWYLIKRNSGKQIELIINLFLEENVWQNAQNKIQPWAIGYSILQHCDHKAISKICNRIIEAECQNSIVISSLLCSCEMLLPLQVYPQYRSVYLGLKKQLIKQLTDKQTPISKRIKTLKEICHYQLDKDLVTQSIGTKSLMEISLKDYQSLSKEELSLYEEEVIDSIVQKFINATNTKSKEISTINKKAIIVSNILSQLPLDDFSNINKKYKLIVENLQKAIKSPESTESNVNTQNLLEYSYLTSIFWKASVGLETLLQWQQNKLLESLLHKIVHQNPQQKINSYHSLVLFSLLNSIYPSFKMSLIEPIFNQIMNIFWTNNPSEKQEEFYILKQQERIRFINRIFLDLSEKDSSLVISKLPIEALEEYQHYEKALVDLSEQESEESQNGQSSSLQSSQKSVQNLFIEYSQLLMKMTTILINIEQQEQTKMQIPNQTVILSLLQCPFSGIKRTCYILLKQLYDCCLVPSKIPSIYQQILQIKLPSQWQLEDISTLNQIYNFSYGWMCLMARRRATEKIQNAAKDKDMGMGSSEEIPFQLTLEDFIQNQELSDPFLSTVFGILADKLDYIKYESDYKMQPNDLRYNDGLNALNFDNESLDLSQNLFSLSVRLLFHYSINFPLFLRNFMDKSKKYKAVCEKILRNFVSDAIFAHQVSMIEMKESEWKASGSLEIYVVKKNKEIYAEYQHDVVRIGMRLVMTPTYPLKPIHLQFGEGLKLEGGSKWSLMLQSQLHNRNNTMINGILLWKENIDKKLQGIEECSICFDIVNPNGQLPKKACKTCKKKFHGNCIMKWFNKSNKSECPLCKSQFL